MQITSLPYTCTYTHALVFKWLFDMHNTATEIYLGLGTVPAFLPSGTVCRETQKHDQVAMQPARFLNCSYIVMIPCMVLDEKIYQTKNH